MEMITRTLSVSTVQYSEATVGENGTPAIIAQPDEKISGAMTKEKALAYLHKKYGAERMFFITNIETTTDRYGMPLDDFVKYAQPITKKSRKAEDTDQEQPESEEDCIPEEEGYAETDSGLEAEASDDSSVIGDESEQEATEEYSGDSFC